jgi:hypothetical protein
MVQLERLYETALAGQIHSSNIRAYSYLPEWPFLVLSVWDF